MSKSFKMTGWRVGLRSAPRPHAGALQGQELRGYGSFQSLGASGHAWTSIMRRADFPPSWEERPRAAMLPLQRLPGLACRWIRPRRDVSLGAASSPALPRPISPPGLETRVGFGAGEWLGTSGEGFFVSHSQCTPGELALHAWAHARGHVGRPGDWRALRRRGAWAVAFAAAARQRACCPAERSRAARIKPQLGSAGCGSTLLP